MENKEGREREDFFVPIIFHTEIFCAKYSVSQLYYQWWEL